MELDPLAFRGTAEYYSIGRPPYSQQLADTMARALSLDGTGQLLDVGCGPGVLVLALATLFDRIVGLDPEEGMLREGARRCDQAGLANVRWIRGVAEDVASLDIAPCRVVTFGQSFHRVHRLEVANLMFDLLETGGSLVLISNVVAGRPWPEGPPYPRIPHDDIIELVIDYLGPGTRNYLATWNEGQPSDSKTPSRCRDSVPRARSMHRDVRTSSETSTPWWPTSSPCPTPRRVCLTIAVRSMNPTFAVSCGSARLPDCFGIGRATQSWSSPRSPSEQPPPETTHARTRLKLATAYARDHRALLFVRVRSTTKVVWKRTIQR